MAQIIHQGKIRSINKIDGTVEMICEINNSVSRFSIPVESYTEVAGRFYVDQAVERTINITSNGKRIEIYYRSLD